MLLEIALNAGSVVLEGAGDVRLPVATGRRRAARCAARSRPHVGPFYGASVYSCSLFIRRSTCGSYRIVSYRDILSDYRIVSIVFSYGCIVPSLYMSPSLPLLSTVPQHVETAVEDLTVYGRVGQ